METFFGVFLWRTVVCVVCWLAAVWSVGWSVGRSVFLFVCLPVCSTVARGTWHMALGRGGAGQGESCVAGIEIQATLIIPSIPSIYPFSSICEWVIKECAVRIGRDCIVYWWSGVSLALRFILHCEGRNVCSVDGSHVISGTICLFVPGTICQVYDTIRGLKDYIYVNSSQSH